MTDILAAVLDACERTPDAPAMSLGSTTLTFGEVRERMLGCATALGAAGFEPGDRVLFSIRPGLDSVCLALGIIAAGGTVVFADPGVGSQLFRARADLAQARWVAAESLLYFASTPPIRPIARRRGLELPNYSSVVPHAQHIVAGRWLPGVPRGAVRIDRLFATTPAVSELATSETDEALIIFTSGTTGAPKAVVHSRRSLGTGLAGFAERVRFTPGERVLTDQLMVGIPALIAGAHWISPPVGADPGARPAAYLGLLEGADVLFAVPAGLDGLLALLQSSPQLTPTLRAVLLGGAPVLRPLLERIDRQLPGADVFAMYGMTEMLPVAIATGEEKLAFEGVGDLVGTVLSTVNARIDEGELVISGPGLASGYLGQPPLTEVRTGDLARLENGRLVLAGRSKDMFIRGTTNVYPGLYEPIIAALEGVSDAVMVGVPNEIGDDAIVVVVVPTDGASGLGARHPVIAGVRRALPGMIDSAVLPDHVLVIDELPRAGRGRKLDRRALTAAVTEFLS